MPASPLLLFDPYTGGHHGQYVQHLVEYWGETRPGDRLDLVLPDGFTDVHTDVGCLIERYADTGVRLHTFPPPLRSTGSLRGLIASDRTNGRLFRDFVTRLHPAHCLLMYFDHMQVSLATGLRFDAPVSISGIYFRPSFHYPGLLQVKHSVYERLTGFRKRRLLARALRNPHFTNLFCLDPYVVEPVRRLRTPARAVPLPDPVSVLPAAVPAAETRARWGVEDARKVALLFGSLTGRKGLYEVLDAPAFLPAPAQQALCLVLTGPVHEAERARLHEAIRTVRADTHTQVVVEDRFFQDGEIQDLIRAGDVVLATYPRHIGSSNVLVRAAQAEVPVLGSDYGVIGEHLRRHRLGWAVDCTDPRAIAAGLLRFLEHPEQISFDAAQARHFAAANTASRFAQTIFEHLPLDV